METLDSFKRKHIKQNRAIIKSNTLYALQLRKAEVEISRLSVENIELRATIARLNDQIKKLKNDKNINNETFKDSVMSTSGQINDLIQQLRGAADTLNALMESDSNKNFIRANLSFNSDDSILDQDINNYDTAEGSYQYATNNTPEIDIALEKLPDKRKSPNMLTIYRMQQKVLQPISEESLSSSPKHDVHSSDLCEEYLPDENESLSTFDHKCQQTKSRIPISTINRPLAASPPISKSTNKQSIDLPTCQKMNVTLKSEEQVSTCKSRSKTISKDTDIPIDEERGGIRPRRNHQNVNYAEPSLRSKLRQGDPFTYSFYSFEDAGQQKTPKQKRRRKATNTKRETHDQRKALSNITNGYKWNIKPSDIMSMLK
ncbi:24288_t:CDS:10 [Cetraspora pellucida]|uniref:24288_t:CDS:1 n=1 Tax=Cetraspora pellucida TaxID=1433469 RepID=A0A9N8ZFE9_9GLOM|nr:24288_t:CDS:10 [Cetraspora pellucida]